MTSDELQTLNVIRSKVKVVALKRDQSRDTSLASRVVLWYYCNLGCRLFWGAQAGAINGKSS